MVIGMATVQTLVSTAEGGRVGLIKDVIVNKNIAAWASVRSCFKKSLTGAGKPVLSGCSFWLILIINLPWIFIPPKDGSPLVSVVCD